MTNLLRCGVQGLPVAEVALIRTLFKLYKHGTNEFCWTLVDEAPYDAMLIDSTLDAAGIRDSHRSVKAVLSIGNQTLNPFKSKNANMLTRPLRSEMLEAWLLQTQREFFPSAVSAAPVLHAKPASAPAVVTVQVSSVGTYRLMRWPHAALLRGDPSLIRMATVLSRRHMRVSELAQVAQQPFGTAYTFVCHLRSAGLLDNFAPALASGSGRPDRWAASGTKQPQKIERSLISRIRYKLGL